jgi:ATP-dependent DNA ligase
MLVRRDGDTVRLFTRRGHDWTDRYPAIAAAAAKLRAKSFTFDGEAVVAGVDGVAVFDALRVLLLDRGPPARRRLSAGPESAGHHATKTRNLNRFVPQ